MTDPARECLTCADCAARTVATLLRLAPVYNSVSVILG